MTDQNASCSSIIEEEAYFEYGSSNFADIVKTKAFVDKTLLIKTLFQKTSMLLITAPRRFRKSTNMDMVKKFVEIQVDNDGVVVDREKSPNHNIFKDNNLLVFQDKNFFYERFATYPVIHVSFKMVSGESVDEVVDKFRYLLHKVFNKHEYLLKSIKLTSSDLAEFNYYFKTGYEKLTKTKVETGLVFLSQCLYKHFNKKVYILIDEYDAPINNTMFEEGIDIHKVNKLLCMIFSNTLENEYVERALLTGISYFATVGLSGANNINKHMFLTNDDFVPFYGLTELEVTQLLTKFKIDPETEKKVKCHYSGYVSLGGIKLFSIWSILHFLDQKIIENYWEDSAIMTNLEEAMNVALVRCCIESLCLRKSVEIEIFKKIEMREIIKLKEICSQEANSETAKLVQPDIYLNFFLQQGYLTFEKHVKDQSYSVKVPNAEILGQLRRKLLNYYDESIIFCLKSCAVSFNKISTSSEDEVFEELIFKFNDLLGKLKNQFVKHNEDTYHCMMVLVLCNTKFLCNTEFIIPNGRVDSILCKDDLGIIVELTYKKSSLEALGQITNKYLDAFNSDCFKNVTRQIYIGLNVSPSNVATISVLVNVTDLKEARHF